jgi:hypothetical protein
VRARGERLPFRVRGAALTAAAVALWVVVHGITGMGDYQPAGQVSGDNPAPAIDALIHGHLTALVTQQPLMGLVSLVWRAPFSASAAWLGGGPHLAYQLGTLACLLPIFSAATWLAARARSRGQWAAAAAAILLIACGPLTVAAVALGHPEEVLTCLLAAGAVILAGQARPVGAGVLLGLAVGTKQWAVVAVPCVLLALSSRRVVAAALATAVAAPLVGLLPLLNPGAFSRANQWVQGLHVANPLSLWWLVAGRYPGGGDASTHLLPLSLTRGAAAVLALALASAAILTYARRVLRRGALPQVDGLALLACLGLVRCVADPLPSTYYCVALVTPLALWEAGTRRRLPLLAALVSVAVDWIPKAVGAAASHGSAGLAVLNLLLLGAGVALGAHLARSAVHPRPEGGAAGQDDERASGWRGSPSSGMGSQAAA